MNGFQMYLYHDLYVLTETITKKILKLSLIIIISKQVLAHHFVKFNADFDLIRFIIH